MHCDSFLTINLNLLWIFCSSYWINITLTDYYKHINFLCKLQIYHIMLVAVSKLHTFLCSLSLRNDKSHENWFVSWYIPDIFKLKLSTGLMLMQFQKLNVELETATVTLRGCFEITIYNLS